jgi:hypothetical protein
MSDEFSLHGVPVHVVEFLDEFLLALDIEIVESGLPELWQGMVEGVEEKIQLPRRRGSARLATQAPLYAPCVTVEGVSFADSLMSR